MKASDEIQLRANKLSGLAEAIRHIEEREINGEGRRLIHLLMVTYSGLTAAQCSAISGYSFAEAGWKAAKITRRLIENDWLYRQAWEEAVKIIHNSDVRHQKTAVRQNF